MDFPAGENRIDFYGWTGAGRWEQENQIGSRIGDRVGKRIWGKTWN